MTTKELLLQEINSMSEIELIETLNIIRTIKRKESKLYHENKNTEEREDWEKFSLTNLNQCYAENEPEYTLESIKEYNQDYERR